MDRGGNIVLEKDLDSGISCFRMEASSLLKREEKSWKDSFIMLK